jgi:hypothetical protein
MIRATGRALAACALVVVAMLVVPSLGWTLFALAIWAAQGIGVVGWIFGDRPSPSALMRWILAIWAGLVVEVIAVVCLYFVVPGLTIDQLAWPLTLALVAISVALHARTPRTEVTESDRGGWIAIALSLVATLLVLRPLLGAGELGFYSSDNGEFANYAVMADITRYHDASTQTGGLAIASREGVSGALAAMVCVLTGKSALWVIQPVAAAFAALAFASFGLCFRVIARALPGPGQAVLWGLFACAILSASSQCFFTLSFVSQYLNLALFFGGIVFLTCATGLPTWRRLAVLAVLFAALVAAYPEMFVPNAALLCAYEIGAATSLGKPLASTLRTAGRSLACVVAAIAGGLLLINRLALVLLLGRAALSGGGWDIYGPHRPILPFVARLVGFTSTFAPPHTRAQFWSAIVATIVVIALVHALVRFRREPEPALRGLYHLGIAFFVGIVGVFWVIGHRHMTSNYVALKFLLGYGWLAFLLVGLVCARAIEARRWVIAPAAIVVATILVGLASPALEYTKKLHRAEKDSLYLDGDACAAALRGRVYVSATRPGNDAIVGRFIAYDHDLLSIEGRWPDGTRQAWFPGQPVMLLGDSRIADDPQIQLPYKPQCSGRGFSLVVPE